MASLVTRALEDALYTGSSPKGHYWAFRHPNPNAPPQTYRLARRSGNGWTLLLAASKATQEVLAFNADTPADQDAVREALKWLGIKGEVAVGSEGALLRLPGGRAIPSKVVGGEKPKKR